MSDNIILSESVNNKTFGILKTFQAKDLRLFRQFAASPFFNKQEKIAAFFEHLIMFHPDYVGKGLSKKELFKKMFPRQNYNDKKMRYLFSWLTLLLEKYLAVTNFTNDTRKYQQALFDENISRNNVPAMSGVYNVSLNREKNKREDAAWFLNRFQLEYKYLIHVYTHQRRKKQSNIGPALEYLDKFYLARKLELSCEAENVSNLLTKEQHSFLLDEMIEKTKPHAYAASPVIQAYLQVLALLRDRENESYFHSLTALLKKHEASFSQEELRELYQYPLNFCVRMINTGKMEFLQKIFEIYKVVIANNVLLPGGMLSQWDFKNIITTSLRLKEFSWADKFIHSYKIYIPEKERKNAFTYNQANLYFHMNEFSKALKLLRNVEFTDLVYQLDTRSMLLKIYFETNDEDALEYHFSAFRKFIRRMRMLSKYQQDNYRNLIRFTQKMVKAADDRTKIRQLIKEVDANPQVADITWLKNKMKEAINQ
jgi:hypothetical protein